MSATVANTNQPYVREGGEGEVLRWFGARLTVKAEHPSLGALDCTIDEGDEPPLHVHEHEDEWLFVLEGEITFYAGDVEQRGGPGALAYFPRRIPHTFVVESGAARLLVLSSPGGFIRMFERAPTTPEQAIDALRAYGCEVVGPNPRQLRTGS